MPKNNYKTAVVTGASEGIGAALSYQLLKQGYKVVGISRSKKKFAKIKKKFRKFNSLFVEQFADVRNYNDLTEIADKIEKVDLLILNAGVYVPAKSDKPILSIYKDQNDINYMGVINTYIAFLKKMIVNKKGTIVVMSSISGWIGLPKASAYGPTKSALRSFAQSARYDLEKHGIKVKLCSPGFVKTSATAINDFYMPGLMNPEEAAVKILKNLKNKKFEITFPFIFSFAMRLISLLPDKVSYYLINKITKNNE